MSLNSNGIFDPKSVNHNKHFTNNFSTIIHNPGNIDSNQAKKQLSKLDDLLTGKQVRLLINRANGGIGDVLMTLPTVTALKQKYDAHITYATNFSYLNNALKYVVEHCPSVDKVIDSGTVKEEDYHAHINLYCPCISHEVPNAIPIHRIDLFAIHAGLESIDRDILYVTTNEEKQWAQNYFDINKLDKTKTIIVQPCASNLHRSYSPTLLKQALLDFQSNYPEYSVIVITHDTDFDKSTDWNNFGFHRASNFAIKELAALVEQCRLVVCQDSSLLHVAGMFKKECIGLFGPTDHRARFYPNMYPLSPGEGLACWPTWYVNTFDPQTFWRMLKPEMITEKIVEVLSLTQSISTTKKYTVI